jgi:hypothetical protein
MLTPDHSFISVMPEVLSRASMFSQNGFPPTDCGNDDLKYVMVSSLFTLWCMLFPYLFISLFLIHLKMEPVQEAVINRGKEHSDESKKSHPAEKCIKSGKQLTAGRIEMVDRSHSSQDHCSVEEGIDPGEFPVNMIARCSEPDREGQNYNGKTQILDLPADEFLPAD